MIFLLISNQRYRAYDSSSTRNNNKFCLFNTHYIKGCRIHYQEYVVFWPMLISVVMFFFTSSALQYFHSEPNVKSPVKICKHLLCDSFAVLTSRYSNSNSELLIIVTKFVII